MYLFNNMVNMILVFVAVGMIGVSLVLLAIFMLCTRQQ